MSADRELLELAAKAAGIEVAAIVQDGIPHRFGGGYWNPLTDDGDALRLAVKLYMQVRVDYSMGHVVTDTTRVDLFGCALVNEGDDAFAATRLAIVRAAAEIGKAMP